jgi:DNA topoisomerase-1
MITAAEPEEVAGEEPASDEVREAAEKVFAETEIEEDVVAEPVTAGEVEPAAEVVTKDCPDCGRPMLLKEDRFGKYWYCSGHPECRHSESYEEESGSPMACPLCNIGNVVTKRTPIGKTFFVCPEPDCEFMAWAKPHIVPCRVCDSPYLVEKKNPSGKPYLRCPRAGCNYMQPLPGNDTDWLPEKAPEKKKVRVRRVAKGAKSKGKIRKVRVVRKKKG